MKRRKHLASLERDILDHIEEETRDNIDRGMTPDEARYAALRKFGNILRTREATREVWSVVWIEQLLQDVRYGLRILRRNPGFTAVAVLTMALGIAVNTAVFSVVNAVLLRALPYPAADRIVAYSDGVSNSKAEHFKSGIEGADFAEWRAQAKSFEGMAGYEYRDAMLADRSDSGPMRVASIAGDFWAITASHPALGHLFEPGAAPGVIVLSQSSFQRRFAADPQIVGKVVILDERPVTVIGVLAPDSRFLLPEDPMGIASRNIEAFVPAPPPSRSSPQRIHVSVVAKLRPGVSIGGALTELRVIETRLLRAFPDRWFPGTARMALIPLRERLVGSVRQPLMILQAAGLFVLLIACANIANLLLARAASRRREIAIRSAIGAGATRVLRQFLVEGTLLALLGGAAGLILARFAITAMARLGPAAVPRIIRSRDRRAGAGIHLSNLSRQRTALQFRTGCLFMEDMHPECVERRRRRLVSRFRRPSGSSVVSCGGACAGHRPAHGSRSHDEEFLAHVREPARIRPGKHPDHASVAVGGAVFRQSDKGLLPERVNTAHRNNSRSTGGWHRGDATILAPVRKPSQARHRRPVSGQPRIAGLFPGDRDAPCKRPLDDGNRSAGRDDDQ